MNKNEKTVEVKTVRVVLHIPQKDMQDTHDECTVVVEKKREWKNNAKCESSKVFYGFYGFYAQYVLQYIKVEEI